MQGEGENRDKYGRLLRHVFINNVSIAEQLLINKHAVYYKKYDGVYAEDYEKLS